MKVFIPISKRIMAGLLVLAWGCYLPAQEKKEKGEEPVYRFKIEKQIKCTPVKNQARTGTCWSFATLSFLESEVLRLKGYELNLSEIYIAHQTYIHKAINYVRRQKNATFGQGGQSHDVFEQIKRTGIVPEEVYSGLLPGNKAHNHSEMSRVLSAILDSVMERKWGTPISDKWLDTVKAVLDIYLGRLPEKFTFQGRELTPPEFASQVVGLNMDDYIEITSYSHHPYYQKCMLEIPDNWNYSSNYYNVPIDDMERIVDNALKNGYSVCWDGDVSETDFSSKETGYAIVPLIDADDKTEAEKNKKPTQPVKEKEVNQELRQQTFDNMTTTDDHLMHIVGLAKDQTGTKFYFTKNSSGTDRKFEGFVYLSRSYFRLKTVAIAIHKDACPADILEKLHLK